MIVHIIWDQNGRDRFNSHYKLVNWEDKSMESASEIVSLILMRTPGVWICEEGDRFGR